MTASPKNLEIEYLEPESIKFYLTKNGFLKMEFKSKDIGRVKLIRAYPFEFLDEFICVHTLEDEEIGIIKDLNFLDEASLNSAREHLKQRYYCPIASQVKSIKEKMGYYYFTVVIDSKEKSFVVRDITKSIRFAKNNHLIIFDVDGNRYEIPEFDKIEKKSRRLLEPYLY